MEHAAAALNRPTDKVGAGCVTCHVLPYTAAAVPSFTRVLVVLVADEPDPSIGSNGNSNTDITVVQAVLVRTMVDGMGGL